MAQEYFINAQNLENKVRELLPSQGGAGAGFDLSASTQIIPIVDLTESAEGSNLRQDLQTAFSFSGSTAFDVSNATSTIISNTGYFRILGNGNVTTASSGGVRISATDGASTKILLDIQALTLAGAPGTFIIPFDFNVFCKAGDSILAISDGTSVSINGITRQIATIDGTLVDP